MDKEKEQIFRQMLSIRIEQGERKLYEDLIPKLEMSEGAFDVFVKVVEKTFKSLQKQIKKECDIWLR